MKKYKVQRLSEEVLRNLCRGRINSWNPLEESEFTEGYWIGEGVYVVAQGKTSKQADILYVGPKTENTSFDGMFGPNIFPFEFADHERELIERGKENTMECRLEELLVRLGIYYKDKKIRREVKKLCLGLIEKYGMMNYENNR